MGREYLLIVNEGIDGLWALNELQGVVGLWALITIISSSS